jgi:membrane protein YfhO
LITDPVNAHFPLHRMIKDSLGKMKIPLWDNSLFCGIPVAPGTFSRYLNPLVLSVLLVFPLPLAHDVLLCMYLLTTGIFTYLYLRKMGLHDLPSLIGAVSWMFNGYAMVWFEFEVIQMLALSLPAMLYFFEIWIRRRNPISLLLFTMAGAVSITSGFAHVLMYQFLFVSTYMVFRYFRLRSHGDGLKRFTKKEILSVGFAVFLGGLLSMDFLLSHVSLTNDSQRRGYSFKELYHETGQLPAGYMATLLFPDFYGSPAQPMMFTPNVRGGNQSYNNYNELCVYAGVLTLFLALAAMPYLLKLPDIAFFGSALLVSLAMAMGSILYYPLMRFFPGLNMTTPTRVLYIFGFTISVLAAFGAQALISPPCGKRGWIFSLWLILVAVGVGMFYFSQTDTGIRWATGHLDPDAVKGNFHFFRQHFSLDSPILRKPMLLFAAAFLLMTLVLFSDKACLKQVFLFAGLTILAFDLISFAKFYNNVSDRNMAYPSTAGIRYLQKDPAKFRIAAYGPFLHNTFSLFRIPDIGGYSSLYPKRYGEYLHVAQYGNRQPVPDRFSRWVDLRRVGTPLLDLINTKYILVPPRMKVTYPALDLVYDKEIRIYRNKNAFPRVFAAHSYLVCEDPAAALAALASSDRDSLRKRVILESEPPDGFPMDNAAAQKPFLPAIRIAAYEQDRIEIDVDADRNAFLIVSDSYHPGWRVTVDGREKTVLRANYIMRAVPFAAGRHRIVFYFRPPMIMTGIIVTALGWLGTIACVTWVAFNRRRQKIPYQFLSKERPT